MRLLRINVDQCAEESEDLTAKQFFLGNHRLSIAFDAALSSLCALKGLHLLVDEVKYSLSGLLAALVIFEVRVDENF